MSTPENSENDTITKRLAKPFEPSMVKYKPQSVKGDRALVVAYVDVRVIQDRLDEVLGVENWQDDYQLLPDSSVMCRLTVKIGKRWITKMDVGSPSEQPDSGDRMKAAFSDALKRTAVKFGIGRYLYRVPQIWVDYDPVKKRIINHPPITPIATTTKSAIPHAQNGNSKNAQSIEPKMKPISPASGTPSTPVKAPESPKAPESAKPAESKKEPAAKSESTEKTNPAIRAIENPSANHAIPTNGKELLDRLQDRDRKLAKEGLCQRGEFLEAITQAGIARGYPADLKLWPTESMAFAVEEAKNWMAKHQSAKPAQKVA